MKTYLLISKGDEWLFLGIAAAMLMIGIAVIVWAIASAAGCEFEEDPIDRPGNDYDYSEQPFIDGYQSWN